MRPLLFTLLIVAVVAPACAPAASRIEPAALGITARDALIEARSVARSWSEDARLRWVEGSQIDARGTALPDGGAWRFHYTAPGRTPALVVEVTSLAETSSEQPPASPPGLIIGDAALDASWIDSDRALEAAAGAAEVAGPVSMLLVPTRPTRWIARIEGGARVAVNATTGEVVAP